MNRMAVVSPFDGRDGFLERAPNAILQNAQLARARAIDPGDEPRSEETPARKAARLWVHQFARALKTCRLYEQNINATVERLLDEVTGTLRRFHEEHGTLALEFTADDVLYDGASTYLARSRDDNL